MGKRGEGQISANHDWFLTSYLIFDLTLFPPQCFLNPIALFYLNEHGVHLFLRFRPIHHLIIIIFSSTSLITAIYWLQISTSISSLFSSLTLGYCGSLLAIPHFHPIFTTIIASELLIINQITVQFILPNAAVVPSYLFIRPGIRFLIIFGLSSCVIFTYERVRLIHFLTCYLIIISSIYRWSSCARVIQDIAVRIQ